ncbi:Furin-like protease 2 [Pseudolycoriella hygida]|uniref:Furin-like protease 2 n=1 Tax=Pseudolycoriella hygida TaxID=35572 RepID=A0A9Q0RV65_9DIPT|nr:Furin-like protease 2 [Pseudolycoriella hygida]
MGRQHRFSYHHHHRIRSGMPLPSMLIVVAVFFITILLQQSQVASGELYSDNSSVYNNIANEQISGSYSSPSTSRLRRSPMFQNEFAVYIPSGTDVADSLADKYGFSNLGQVRWVQQQHEKVRKKRDYASELNYPRLSNYGGLLRNVAPQTRVQYRDTSVHNIFPDPLFKEQWYLNGGAKDGLDMNVAPAWQKGYTGKGIVVSILDDGIQTNHPDLAQNYDPGASYDINGNDSDPMPQDNGDNKHGTRCAGEVAAVAFNNYCGVGVAYNASIGETFR